MHSEILLVYQVAIIFFFSNFHDLTSSGKLARFPISGMISHLLNGPYVQIDNSWMPSTCECQLLYLYADLAMLVPVSQLGLSNCVPPFTACIVFSGTKAFYKVIYFFIIYFQTWRTRLCILASTLLLSYVLRQEDMRNLFIFSLFKNSLLLGSTQSGSHCIFQVGFKISVQLILLLNLTFLSCLASGVLGFQVEPSYAACYHM